MAADEAIFTALSREAGGIPVIRLYRWQEPCMTIGYFQKYADFEGHGLKITRRMTGGLSVAHGKDISYSFSLPGPAWPSLYDQNETYRLVHDGIREGLAGLGVAAEFYGDKAASSKGGICVQTLFPYDLLYKGRKIAGSCQRRRGTHLLIQGSLHVSSAGTYDVVAAALKTGWEKALNVSLEVSALTQEETALSGEFSESRYLREDWNKKY